MIRILIMAFLITSASCFATEQISDLLIIEKDTFYLKSFPLETLKFEKSPFTYGEYNYPHSGCWRGYCATWKIIDGKLALMTVAKMDSTCQKLDIIDFFKQNDYSPKLVDGYVYADWYTANFLKYSSMDNYRYSDFYLADEHFLTVDKNNVQLFFETGILKENNIVDLDSYQVGDTLTYSFSHYPPGAIKAKSVNLRATIVDMRPDMAQVKIYSYDTQKKKEIEEIRKYFGNMVDTDTLLTNPRYWHRESNAL